MRIPLTQCRSLIRSNWPIRSRAGLRVVEYSQGVAAAVTASNRTAV